jgi:hypothetical protein
MKTRRLLILATASMIALGGLSGCATNFKADVSRYHAQLPPPEQGQTFTVMPDDPKLAGSLEFAHYADLLSERLGTYGYKASADPASAQLIVRLTYGVDKGTTRVRSSGFARSGFYDPFYFPGYYRGWGGWRGRYGFGFYDPFLWGGGGWGGGNDVESYVVYQSQLRMKIDKADGSRVFEGSAKAQSLSDKMTYLIPNLMDALFSGFPGKNGEEVQVTVAPEPKAK